MKKRLHALPALAASAMFTATLPALASDGVIEINQAKAVAGLVTTGDAPGFPVTLNLSGSYVLTSNLDLPAAMSGPATNGIQTGADNISIDLNGFTIIGVPMGTGIGITGAQRAKVSNGFILFFGGGGISLTDGTVDNIVANNNGAFGIKVANGIVSNSITFGTSVDGIWVSNGIIESCRVSDSFTGAGFHLGTGILRDSTSTGSNNDELYCDSNCAFGGNYLSCTVAGDCYGGMGTLLQIPAGSNMCGSSPCS